MQKRIHAAMILALAGMIPFAGFAQIEKRPSDILRSDITSIESLRTSTKSPVLASHLANAAKNKSPRAASNAARVARAVAGSDRKEPFVQFIVPATGENQYLPDVYPADGKALGELRIVSARDEYEPGSFVIYPLKDLGKVQLRLSEFRTKDGKVFPASALDLKVVKVWYQNGNAWYSYFGDTELKTVPELLLNDEDLIEVDPVKKQNFARLTEKDGSVHKQWITPPMEIDLRFDEHYVMKSTFRPMMPNFRDAATLQKTALNEGEFKQFFLTAHVAKDQAPGIYRGSVILENGRGGVVGSIPAAIRVLPFALPAPKTYYDVTKDYLTASYSYISLELIAAENGGDYELAKKQLYAILKNQVEHNQTTHWLRGNGPMESEYLLTLETMKKAGMRMDPLLGGGVLSAWGEALNKYTMGLDAKLKSEWFRKNLGHSNVFLGYGDEPGAGWVMSARPVFEAYQKEGLKFAIAGGNSVLFKAGYCYDLFNNARPPEDREATRRWNEIGRAWVAWYAAHHVGPENPAYNRRQYGLAPYLANYSATCNYAHHLGPYNDRSTTYRPMVFAYGIYDGVLDTLQWEGYREGIDDIRYATLMKTLALEASKSPDIKLQYAGRQALQFLALEEPDKIEMDSARLEMIRHILKLKELLKK